MPAESKAQARWAFANQDKGGKLGKAAKEFVPHGKGSMSKLPATSNKEQRSHMADVLGSASK